MDRRRFLISAAASLGIPGVTLAQSGRGGGDKNLIVLLAVGGWDVTFCFDPKLGCTQPDGSSCFIEGPEVDQVQSNPDDREAVQTFGNIPVMVNPAKRPAVGEFFSAWHHRSHVINGIWTGSIAHDPCRYRLLTGTPDGTKPDLATIHGFTNGGSRPLGSVDLSGWSISGPLAASSGRVGHNSQIKALLDPDTNFRAPPQAPFNYPLYAPKQGDQAAIEDYLASRAEELKQRFGGSAANDLALLNLVESVDRGKRFTEQAAGILDTLTIGQESRFFDQLDMAVDLIDQSVCRAVTVDTTYDWDTHDVNAGQHGYYNGLFGGLSHLMEQLESRGLLDNTVVAVISEMTRTPLRNAGGGKDHWGHTSAMLMGAVQGDRVSGATDHYLESIPVNLATGEVDDAGGDYNKYDNFCAGVLELVDVDPEEWLPNVVPFRGAHPS